MLDWKQHGIGTTEKLLRRVVFEYMRGDEPSVILACIHATRYARKNGIDLTDCRLDYRLIYAIQTNDECERQVKAMESL